MRRRLTIAILGTVVAALVLAGLGTLVLARVGAREATRDDITDQAKAMADMFSELNLVAALARPPAGATAAPNTRQALIARLRERLSALAQDLSSDDIALLIGPNLDQLEGTGPRGITLDDDDIAALKASPERTVSGERGSVVYAAAVGDTRAAFGTFVVMIAREPASTAAPAGRWFLLASVGTIALAALVAKVVSRGLTQPLRAAQAATHSIADGDFSVRLPEPPAQARDEIADLSRSINSMASQLERSRGLERQFLMSITHDLRTPLTSIQGYAEALTDGTITDPQQAGRIIEAQSRRLNDLVTDLLDLARLDAKQFRFDLQTADVRAIAESSVRAVEARAAQRGIDVQLAAGDPVSAVLDLRRTAQVIGNLLDNALRFAQARVEVGVSLHEGWAVVSVADDGPGIAAEDLPFVFERLYVATHRPTPKESGSGLGLAIVRELVAAMGGHVHAHSPVTPDGRGTQMVVYLRPAGAAAGGTHPTGAHGTGLG